MTQFASSLYPQTNPTNPALLDLRSIYLEDHKPFGIKLSNLAEDWLDLLELDPHMIDPRKWGNLVDTMNGRQIKHLARVLERLAALSG